MSTSRGAGLALCIAVIGFVGPAWAQESRPQEGAPADSAAAAPQLSTPAAPSGLQPLDDAALAGVRSGAEKNFDGAVTTQTLAATNTGARLSVGGNLSDGAFNIGAGAFGFNGVGNFVMNTGNQNNLQGTLNVTIVLAPTAH